MLELSQLRISSELSRSGLLVVWLLLIFPVLLFVSDEKMENWMPDLYFEKHTVQKQMNLFDGSINPLGWVSRSAWPAEKRTGDWCGSHVLDGLAVSAAGTEALGFS